MIPPAFGRLVGKDKICKKSFSVNSLKMFSKLKFTVYFEEATNDPTPPLSKNGHSWHLLRGEEREDI